jgi:hypothetical protein
MSFTNPSVADFKARFTRDFPYGSDESENVLDSDITTAISDAELNINTAIFGTQEQYSYAFLLLSAHYLVENLRASSQGISGQFSWLQSSRGVGSVSESLAIPDQILANPAYSFYSKTNYGARYLMYIWPLIKGVAFTVEGGTRP